MKPPVCMPCAWQVLYLSVQNNRSLPQEEDSLDAEDLFDLEGMDSRNNMNSDQDDYDSDGKWYKYSAVVCVLSNNRPLRFLP